MHQHCLLSIYLHLNPVRKEVDHMFGFLKKNKKPAVVAPRESVNRAQHLVENQTADQPAGQGAAKHTAPESGYLDSRWAEYEQNHQMTVSDVVRQFARKVQLRTPAQIVEEIEYCRANLQRIDIRHADAVKRLLLPIEAALKEELDRQTGSMAADLERRLETLYGELAAAKIDERYQRLDMGFLQLCGWSSHYGCALPLFAMIDVRSDLFWLQSRAASGRGQIENSSSLPEKLWEQFDFEPLEVVSRKLCEKRLGPKSGSTVSLIARFAGALPRHIRELLSEQVAQFHALYLVVKAPDWNILPHQASLREDADAVTGISMLVVGRNGDNYWLLTTFDPIGADEYVKSALISSEKMSAGGGSPTDSAKDSEGRAMSRTPSLLQDMKKRAKGGDLEHFWRDLGAGG
jgi:hypothetical protein